MSLILDEVLQSKLPEKQQIKKITILNTALTGTLRSFDEGNDSSGKWKCRYLKLGPEEQLVIHDWYSCKIFDDGTAGFLKKS